MAGTSSPIPSDFHVEKRPRIFVVGAGIIGVCIAYNLAQRGADVTVLDKLSPGSGCTQGAFAMLIASHTGTNDPDFNALYGLAVAEWRNLPAQLGESLPIQWGGMVHWAQPGEAADELVAASRQLQSWGVQVEILANDIDVARLVPGTVAGPLAAGMFLPDHGAVDIAKAFSVLLRKTKELGVQFRIPIDVISIQKDVDRRPRLITTDGTGEQLGTADRIVIAAGAGTPALASTLGAHVPVDVVSGTLAYSKPMPARLHRILNGPLGSSRQNPDGRIVTGLDYAPGADGSDVSNAYGQSLLQRAASVVPELAGMELDHMVIGHVPIPADTRPIIGFCDGPAKTVYVATMMSGITMAPLMGRLVATEIMGHSLAFLKPYRPDRFSEAEG